MSVLVSYFDKSVNQASPVQPSYVRVVNFDEDGNEIVSWKQTDYPSVQKRNGSYVDWSLDSLLKAGINPDFGIRTGNLDRMTLENVASEILADVDVNFKHD